MSRWREDPDDRERLTLWVCPKHLARMQKAGTRGWAHDGAFYKTGFW